MTIDTFRNLPPRSAAAGACLLVALSSAEAAEALNALVWCDTTPIRR